MSPNFSKGDRVWVRRQRKNIGDKTCPHWDGPYEVVARKAHNLYVIQVDQRRLVHVHVDSGLSSKYVGRVALRIAIPRSPMKPSYRPTIRFGEFT